MTAGSTADSEVYVDGGDVTVTVTANTSAAEHPALLDVRVAGSSIGTARVESIEPAPFPFHGRARASGPIALRIAFSQQPGSSDATDALHVEKIVITQP